MTKHLVLIALLVLVVSACNPTPIVTTQTSALTTPPTNAPSPSPSPSPVPPTATPSPTNTPAPTATITPQVYGPDNFPKNVNPLTGLVVSDPSLLERRPLSTKIQIFPRGGRPPWGLSLADIVYDYYQNNGLTRFHAVFYGSDAEQVGPIRSGRLFDRHIVRMYKTVFAFGSADRRIYSRFLDSNFSDRLVVEGSSNCPPMCRIDPNGFNYLVTNTEELSKYASEKGMSNERQDLDGMSFDSRTPDGGQGGSQVFVRYSISSYNRWDFDPASGAYLRFQDTQEDSDGLGEGYAALEDRLTGQQISADNVVILLLPHSYAYQSRSGSSEIIEILVDGSGEAYAFRDGQVYQVKWNRPENESVLFLTFLDDKPYPFKPGNTWFQVIGTSSKIEINGGIWRFQFSIP